LVGKRKNLPSKSELNQLYVIDKKSMREIGELFVGGASKIRCLLIEYKIPVQKRGAWGLGQTKETNSSIMKISKSKMGHTVPTLTRQKISKTLTGRPSPKKGKPMSQTAYDNVKKSGTWYKKGNKSGTPFEKGRTSEFKGQTKETNPAIMKRSITATGKTRTDEQKNTMSISRKILLKENPDILKHLEKTQFKKGNPPHNKGKKASAETIEKNRISHLGKKASAETKKLLSDINSAPERKALQKEVFKRARKTIARPNKKEIEIGEILEGIGIKCKFLQDIDYKTLENKPNSKEMDIVWKDSLGNKKIIEYNGRYHFDPRDHEPDEVHEVHRKPTKCQDIWDEETMILNQIRNAGHQILVVWQKDFLKDYENEVKRIIEFATKT
jgi:hypothetical protein